MMTTRRRFLATTGSTVAATAMGSAERTNNSKEEPLFSFGLMADCQYADADPSGTRFYRESARKLDEAIRELNRHELEFTFHLGDFIDRDFKSFATLKPIAAKLKSRLYHVLGNHDFDVEENLRSMVPAELGLTTTYYAIRHAGFRFLLLDTTEVSTYRYPPSDPRSSDAREELNALKKAGKSYAQSWNSRAGDKQLSWIGRQLEEATKAGESVLTFGHHPVLPEEVHCSWNCSALHELLSKFPCCKAYLNGHRHTGGYEQKNGMHYLTLHGMLDTRENAFSCAKLYRSHLEIQGFGRQTSRRLEFR